MAVAYVGITSVEDNTDDPSITHNATAGNLLVLLTVTFQVGGGDVTGVSSGHGTWVQEINQNSPGEDTHFEQWYCPNVTGGSFTITVTTTDGSVPLNNLVVVEYSGVATTSPVDVTTEDTIEASGTSTSTGTTATTGLADSVSVACFTASDTVSAAGIVKDADYTERWVEQNLNSIGGMYTDRILTATGTQEATFTHNSLTERTAHLVVYKGVAAGGLVSLIWRRVRTLLRGFF